MANRYEFTPEQSREWEAWLATRPPAVRELARRFPPHKLFLLKSSGHRVYPLSYGETPEGKLTLTVAVTGEYNLLTFARNVFGIRPEDLEQCELPAPGEPLGAVIADTEKAVEYVRLRTAHERN